MASAELYSPLTRQTTALPNLSLPRASHRAVRFEGGPLQGMVLITGGVTTGGVVTATCELFEPGSGQFLPAPPMVAPRAGHAITLLDDGRVLVTGGVADWQNAGTAFVTALNTTQRSAELFDPQTFTWTQLPDMFEPRFGHTQTKLLDGRVLVVSGIGGGFTGTNPVATPGQMPFYSYSCEVFDPATLTFQPTTSLGPVPTSPFFRLNGRGFHGASLLPNGHVLITGGFVNGTQNGEAVPTETCGEWDGTSWVLAAPLAIPRAFHTQVEFGGGALLTGGFVGDLTQLLTTAVVTRHDVTSVTDLAPIGTDGLAGSAAPRATHTCTPLYDGTMLIYGGAQWPLTLGDGWIYTPN